MSLAEIWTQARRGQRGYESAESEHFARPRPNEVVPVPPYRAPGVDHPRDGLGDGFTAADRQSAVREKMLGMIKRSGQDGLSIVDLIMAFPASDQQRQGALCWSGKRGSLVAAGLSIDAVTALQQLLNGLQVQFKPRFLATPRESREMDRLRVSIPPGNFMVPGTFVAGWAHRPSVSGKEEYTLLATSDLYSRTATLDTRIAWEQGTRSTLGHGIED